MSSNRIAIYGHRGRFSSRIVSAFIASGAAITVLYRPGSDISILPANIPKIEVDVNNEDALVAALQDIDIVLSLVGDRHISREFGFVKAIPRTKVKLFVPSDLGLRYGADGMTIPLLAEKEKVQEDSRQADIPLTVVLIANFAEFTLGSIVMGIDVEGNRLLYTGNAEFEKASMCTADYVAAAYVSIFATSSIPEISNRAISLVELAPTGQEIAAALERKHGKTPTMFRQTTEKVMEDFSARLNTDLWFIAPAWYYRKLWGTGELTSLLTSDVWDVPSYKKATLDELIVEGKVENYRDLSAVIHYFEEALFDQQ